MRAGAGVVAGISGASRHTRARRRSVDDTRGETGALRPRAPRVGIGGGRVRASPPSEALPQGRAPDNHDAIAAPLARDPRLETEPALPSSRSRISPRISSPRTARSANSPLAVPPPPGCSATVDGAFPTTTTTADPPTLPSTRTTPTATWTTPTASRTPPAPATPPTPRTRGGARGGEEQPQEIRGILPQIPAPRPPRRRVQRRERATDRRGGQLGG